MSHNILVKLGAVNAVLVTLEIDGRSLAILPPLVKSASDKEHFLPVLVGDRLPQTG